MRVSVIVPVYNEEETIAQVLKSLSHVPLELEVVVVDDASTDGTWAILQQLRQYPPFHSYRYIHHEHNLGKGAGLRTGFHEVSGQLIIVQDADMEYNPHEIPALVRKWEEMGDPEAAVYGRRNLSTQAFPTRWGNRFLTQVTNVLFGSHIHDMETCYKLLPGVLAHALPMEGQRFEIEPEITACLLQAGYTISEVPISYTPRKNKKLNPWKDGWPALAMLLKRRFSTPFVISQTSSTTVVPVKEKEAISVHS